MPSEHSWTLAVEEQFYLIWPLAVCPDRAEAGGPARPGDRRRRPSGSRRWATTPGSCPTSAAPSPSAGPDRRHPRRPGEGRHATVTRSLCVLPRPRAGLALAYLHHVLHRAGRSDGRPRGWPGATRSRTSRFYTVHFGLVGFVAVNAGAWFLAPLADARELTYLGEISYGMYLYHMPVYWLVGGGWIHVGRGLDDGRRPRSP